MSPQGFFNFLIFNSLLLLLPLCAIVLWRKPGLWLHLFTLFLGIVVGWLDSRATEVSATVLLLLTFGFFVGFARPRLAWLSALLLGIWVPVFACVAYSLHVSNLTPTELVTSFLALLFALAGVCSGVVVRRLVAQERVSELFE